jgi:hypothetical protein
MHRAREGNGLRKSPSHRPGLAVGVRGSLGEGVRTLAVNLNCRKPNWFPCAGKKKPGTTGPSRGSSITGRPSGRPSLFAIRPSWVIVFARQQHIRVEQRQQKPLIPDDPLALEGENEGGGRVVARDPRQFDIGAGVGPRQLVALQRFDLRASSGFPAQSVRVSQDSPPSAIDACYTNAHGVQRHRVRRAGATGSPSMGVDDFAQRRGRSHEPIRRIERGGGCRRLPGNRSLAGAAKGEGPSFRAEGGSTGRRALARFSFAQR